MGFTSILKRFFTAQEPELQLTYAGAKQWLQRERRVEAEEERDAQRALKERVGRFLTELDVKREALAAVDYESRNVEKRAKAIVRGNLQKYLLLVETLRSDVAALDEEEPAASLVSLQHLLKEFATRSEKNYQRATLLIGEEIAQVKRCVADFARALTQMAEQEGSAPPLAAIDGIVQRIDEEATALKECRQRVTSCNKRLQALAEREAAIQASINELRNSDGFARQKEKRKQIEKKLKDELRLLKSMIDFKALGNEFHTDEKRMRIIQEYKTAFAERFRKDQRIMALLAEAKLQSAAMVASAERIAKAETALAAQTPNDGTAHLVAEREQLVRERASREQERTKELKRQEKLRVHSHELKNELRAALAARGIILKG